MSMTDPISDMLTRIRNAHCARQERVEVPASKLKIELARILREEGFIKHYKTVQDGRQGMIRIYLKYSTGEKGVISGLRRISKPGRRVYVSCRDIPEVVRGMGVAILSTPKGILTGRKAREANMGGEVLCYVW
ncbi:MAG: 30S ribosomal protein S8 [Nitrospirae bacterium]|nr:30S ribosomal protein S8 [Nitrospirota bacterium]